MIILEGPDGSGKTTLGQKLVKDRFVEQVLSSPARTRGNVPLWEQSIRYINKYGSNQRIAVDRFLYSELVYGPILRKTSQITTRQHLQMVANIIESGSLVIFCLPKSWDKLKLDQEENPEVHKNIIKIWESYMNYWEILTRMYQRVYRYSWSEDFGNYTNLIDKLEDDLG